MTPYVLGQRSADAVRQILSQGPDPTRRRPGGGNGAPVWALVKCTSATPAGGSGVAATLYPAVRITGDATAATPATAGDVWLTVLGPGGTAVTPTSTHVYPCLVGGWVDFTGDARPRCLSLKPWGTGYTGSQTIVTDVTWNTSTCVMTKTTKVFTWAEGILTGVV